jgi:hypothetical protein
MTCRFLAIKEYQNAHLASLDITSLGTTHINLVALERVSADLV